jgi:hypothetical protein
VRGAPALTPALLSRPIPAPDPRLLLLLLLLRSLVSISEVCCVKCASQGCSAGCADMFLPFHDQCKTTAAYKSLMPLGGGELADFDDLAVRCR